MLGFLGGIIFTGLAIGFLFAIVVALPCGLYTIPYFYWLGGQQSMGRYKNHDGIGFWRTVRNATRLYKAWITHTEPTF